VTTFNLFFQALLNDAQQGPGMALNSLSLCFSFRIRELVGGEKALPKFLSRGPANRTEVPIILCTGYSGLINEEKAKAFDIREFIVRPDFILNLAQTVRRLLDESL
jgi:hypothetical protein